MSQFPTQQLSQAPNQQPPIGAPPDLNAQLLAADKIERAIIDHITGKERT